MTVLILPGEDRSLEGGVGWLGAHDSALDDCLLLMTDTLNFAVTGTRAQMLCSFYES